MSCWTHKLKQDTYWTPGIATGIYESVDVEQGTLRGQEKVSIFFPDKKYYSFESIPYAKPPVGPLRFKDPEEPETWPGVRDAIKEIPIDPPEKYPFDDFDYKHQTRNLTDDFLYLDVDTPQIGGSEKPVIVWLYSLPCTKESGFGPQVFGVGHYMVEDVVFVTVQYRYSVLGFLCLDHEEVPGNAGLKDQVMALKWVQRNISKFGGDPNNVTLYGFGAAAAFVHYHLMSPLSKGLFHRVIIQGDCVLNPHSYATRESAIKKAFRISCMLRREIENTNDLLEFLRAVPVADLLLAAEHTYYPGEDNFCDRGPFGKNPFVPSVEVPATKQSFLPLSPRELLKQGRLAKVPTIIGTSNFDGISMVKCCNFILPCVKSRNLKGNEPLVNLAKVVGYTVDGEESGEWAEEIKKNYFCYNSCSKSEMAEKVKDCFFYQYSSAHHIELICRQLFCDYEYYVGFDDSTRMQLEHLEEPVYAFEFMLNIENPLLRLCKHCTPREPNIVYKWLIKMWISFAKTGNPNNETMEVKWEAARKDSFCYLKISDTLSLVRGWIAEDRMKMWQELFEKYPDIREKYSQIYIRRVLSETEKTYLEPELQLLFGSDD